MHPLNQKKGNTEMKRLLTTTVAASALALMIGMMPAMAEERDPNAKPGGAIVITYKDDVATLDPAIGSPVVRSTRVIRS